MSAEGEAIRSNDYRKDTTVKAPSTRPAAVLGLDVGKSSHWACLIDRDGEVLASAPVRNREAELDALFASAPAGTLVGLAKRALKGVELLAVKTPDDLDAARTLLEEHSA